MKIDRIYLDSSAYLAVLLGEVQAPIVKNTIGNAIMCSSSLLLIEVERNLVRLTREKHLSTDNYEAAIAQFAQDREGFLIRDLTPDLCITGLFPPVRLPRSSDLVHLRTAEWFRQNGGLVLFITCDRAQADAARDIGLSVAFS